MEKEIEFTAISTAFFSFLYIVISVVYKLNISGQIQCFGLVFSVRRAINDDNNNENNNPSNNNIVVGNSNNNNDITQEIELVLENAGNDDNV
jgi:hypothetical protein